jgi:hypothetical protein
MAEVTVLVPLYTQVKGLIVSLDSGTELISALLSYSRSTITGT